MTVLRVWGRGVSWPVIIVRTVSHDSNKGKGMGEHRKGLEYCDTQAPESCRLESRHWVRAEAHKNFLL